MFSVVGLVWPPFKTSSNIRDLRRGGGGGGERFASSRTRENFAKYYFYDGQLSVVPQGEEGGSLGNASCDPSPPVDRTLLSINE